MISAGTGILHRKRAPRPAQSASEATFHNNKSPSFSASSRSPLGPFPKLSLYKITAPSWEQKKMNRLPHQKTARPKKARKEQSRKGFGDQSLALFFFT
jgi:hypothetical protein